MAITQELDEEELRKCEVNQAEIEKGPSLTCIPAVCPNPVTHKRTEETDVWHCAAPSLTKEQEVGQGRKGLNTMDTQAL